MKIKSFPFWLFLSLDVCLGLVILAKFLPAAIKAGSIIGFAGSVVAAIPWSVVAGLTYLTYKKFSKTPVFVR